jgi:hypothetical protein
MFTNYLKSAEPFIDAQFTNTILFGPENSGKYTQALHIAEKYSNSNLKYSRKIEIDINSEKYYFNISDIHFEIDFELLGTTENVIWLEFITHIRCIVDTQQRGIVICKNFHCIKDELLSIFHTFMRDPRLKFILLTKHISYLPTCIKDKCVIYHLKTRGLDSYSLQYIGVCNQIVDYIIEQNKDVMELRELLYQLLTYNYDIHECVRYIYFELIRKEFIRRDMIQPTFTKMIRILKHYNTNYRPIYHLELLIFTLYLSI